MVNPETLKRDIESSSEGSISDFSLGGDNEDGLEEFYDSEESSDNEDGIEEFYDSEESSDESTIEYSNIFFSYIFSNYDSIFDTKSLKLDNNYNVLKNLFRIDEIKILHNKEDEGLLNIELLSEIIRKLDICIQDESLDIPREINKSYLLEYLVKKIDIKPTYLYNLGYRINRKQIILEDNIRYVFKNFGISIIFDCGIKGKSNIRYLYSRLKYLESLELNYM